MTSAKRPSAGAAKSGPRGRRRPAPTIELRATEIASKPVPPPKAAAGETAGPAAPSSSPQVSTASAAGEPRKPEPNSAARAETPRGRAQSESSQASSPRPSIAWLPPDFPWPLVGAGAAGAVLALVVLLVAGLLPSRDSGVGALDARLERLEQQLADLASRPVAASVDPKTVDSLAARIAKSEAALTTLRVAANDPALANRIASLEGEARALAERQAVLSRRSDEIASVAADARQRAEANATALAEAQKAAPPGPPPAARGDVEALANRVAALERAEKTIEAELSKRVAGGAGNRSVRLAVAAGALRTAVERGDPFAAELAAAKEFTAEPQALAPLEPFASSGLPTVAALSRELSALVPALVKAAGAAPREGSFLEKLQANAEKLVRIRPVEDVSGDDPAAVISRIEAAAARSDLAGALAALTTLPANVRAPAQNWITKAEARNAAVETSRRLAAGALAALGK